MVLLFGSPGGKARLVLRATAKGLESEDTRERLSRLRLELSHTHFQLVALAKASPKETQAQGLGRWTAHLY